MKCLRHVSLVIAVGACRIYAQGTLDSARLLQPSADSWPMHNGDYSGRRFSPLSTINAANVSAMTLAWVYRANPGAGQTGGGGDRSIHRSRARRSSSMACCTSRFPIMSGRSMRATGREIWHSTWRSKGGWHIGNRGVAVLGDTVYVETPGLQPRRAQHPRRQGEVGARRSAISNSSTTRPRRH